MTLTKEHILDSIGVAELDEAVRSFPRILENLRKSYEELEARATRVEDELCSKVEELDGVRRHLEAVLQSLPCGVVVRDAAGEIVQVNTAAQSILGVGIDGLQAGHEALMGDQANGKPHQVTVAGRRVVIASSYSPVRGNDGQLNGSVEILDDHTERVEMTERLHAGDKMAALGTMAAGVAHEIRNPLNAIKGFASLLVKRKDQTAQARRWCELIVGAATEADAIIENMLSFGSPERLRTERIGARELLESAVHLALPDKTPGVEISMSIEIDAFAGDRIKLRQAIRNLIANAIDAQRDQPGTSRVALAITRSAGDVVIQVSDAGPGVDEEIRPRIFDPFFTNHPDGTGLGLALVSTIVRLHGGSVRVSPEPSDLGGASFLIRIPSQLGSIAD